MLKKRPGRSPFSLSVQIKAREEAIETLVDELTMLKEDLTMSFKEWTDRANDRLAFYVKLQRLWHQRNQKYIRDIKVKTRAESSKSE